MIKSSTTVDDLVRDPRSYTLDVIGVVAKEAYPRHVPTIESLLRRSSSSLSGCFNFLGQTTIKCLLFLPH